MKRPSQSLLKESTSQAVLNGDTVNKASAAKAKESFLQTLKDYQKTRDDPQNEGKQCFAVSDFKIGLQIGQGSFAVVKRSVHRGTGHTVALKIYEKKNLTQESASLALHREIFVLANMEHENIMRLYEVVDSRTHVHLVMELCQGKNLYHFLKKRKPVSRLDESVARDIFR